MPFESAGRRFARFVTDAVVTNPARWRWLRPLFAFQWTLLAPSWDDHRRPDSLDPYLAALDRLPSPPARALDVGTGTGAGALAIASRFPSTLVVGVDFSAAMIERAASKVDTALSGRVSFRCADASALPFRNDEFDLVAHSNMIPFFDEVARVLRPGGHAVFAFSGGADTPIYVSDDRLESELGERGFADFIRVARGRGTAFIARKGSG